MIKDHTVLNFLSYIPFYSLTHNPWLTRLSAIEASVADNANQSLGHSFGLSGEGQPISLENYFGWQSTSSGWWTAKLIAGLTDLVGEETGFVSVPIRFLRARASLVCMLAGFVHTPVGFIGKSSGFVSMDTDVVRAPAGLVGKLVGFVRVHAGLVGMLADQIFLTGNVVSFPSH